MPAGTARAEDPTGA